MPSIYSPIHTHYVPCNKMLFLFALNILLSFKEIKKEKIKSYIYWNIYYSGALISFMSILIFLWLFFSSNYWNLIFLIVLRLLLTDSQNCCLFEYIFIVRGSPVWFLIWVDSLLICMFCMFSVEIVKKIVA